MVNRYNDMAKQFSLDSSDQIFYNNRANKLLKHTNILCFKPSSEGLFFIVLRFSQTSILFTNFRIQVF